MNKPILYDIVDKLSREVTDIAPQFMEDRPIASNMLYGFLGSYILTRIGTKIISKNLDQELLKVYLKIENVASKILPLTAFGYAIIDPDGAKELMQTHPVYTAGMISATLGTSLALKQDYKRIKENMSIDSLFKE